MLQRAGPIAEKALLHPTSQNSLTDGVYSMPLLLALWDGPIPMGGDGFSDDQKVD